MHFEALALTGVVLVGCTAAATPAARRGVALAPVSIPARASWQPSFSGPRIVAAAADFVVLPEELGVVSEPLGRVFVAGPAGLESLDLATGAVVWHVPSIGVPLAVRGETVIAVVRAARGSTAQLAGFDLAGRELFRSQPFRFSSGRAVRTTVQPGGAELVSWMESTSCGGVGGEGCGRSRSYRVTIAAVTGQATELERQPAATEMPIEPSCPGSLELREIPRPMRLFEPLPPMDGSGMCAPINPFYFRSMPTLVAGTTRDATLHHARPTADGSKVETVSLGKNARWAITLDGTHVATYTDALTTPGSAASSQTLRVYALDSLARIFSDPIAGIASPFVTVIASQVLYVTASDHRQLVSAGSHVWTHAVALPAPVPLELPSASAP